jgi:hypothetical protein
MAHVTRPKEAPGGPIMNTAQPLRLRRTALLPLAAAAVAFACTAARAVEPAEDRVLRSAEGFAPTQGAAAEPRVREERSVAAADVVTKQRQGTRRLSATASLGYDDAWFFDATAETFYDDDGDGYYHLLRTRFDVDTVWPSAWVYAEIYLSADGETWEHLHSTDDFEVLGQAPDDDYEVETELVSGYITALYDVLIELYDADTGEFVSEYGPAQSSAFSLVPLEDAYRDGVQPEPEPDTVVVVDEGGGGAIGWATLPLLGALLAARRRKLRRGAADAGAVDAGAVDAGE